MIAAVDTGPSIAIDVFARMRGPFCAGELEGDADTVVVEEGAVVLATGALETGSGLREAPQATSNSEPMANRIAREYVRHPGRRHRPT